LGGDYRDPVLLSLADWRPGMKRLRAWATRLAGLLFTRKREQDHAEEIESHLRMHIDDNLRSGMTPEQARREAILRLGGVEQTRQAYRDRASLPFVEALLQDLHFAARQMRKNPAFAATAILIL